MSLIVQDVIQQLTAPVDKLETTVDTLKFGSPKMEVTGVVVSFMPSYAAIKKTVELGANLLITMKGYFTAIGIKTILVRIKSNMYKTNSRLISYVM